MVGGRGPRRRRAPKVVPELLGGRLPALRFGDGPPLLALVGLDGRSDPPVGGAVSTWTAPVQLLAERFTVHVATRARGLRPGTTMHDLADDVAHAVRTELGARVPVIGTSTGGSVALQLTVDHPELVERLVLVCSACRLSERGRRVQQRLADLTRAGRARAAWAGVGRPLAGSQPGGAALGALLWLTAPWSAPADPSDLLATIAAEDAFDVGADLHRVTAPTLLVAGARDGFYSPDLFRRTAHGVVDGTLFLDPRGSHMSVAASRRTQRLVLAFLEDGVPRLDAVP